MQKMINKSVEERLFFWIKSDHYRPLTEGQATVEEKKDDGVAIVHCTLPPGQAFELTLEGKPVSHLNSQKCTDGILLLQTPDGLWELHIIECKRTVNRSKWSKVKQQFEASIQRSFALLASIGVYPAKIKLHRRSQPRHQKRDPCQPSPQ